jgi:hypothetical protein
MRTGTLVLAAAAALLSASVAQAEIVDAQINMGVISMSGPSGWYPANPQVFIQNNGGVENVTTEIGGIATLSGAFEFNTSLGTLNTTPNFQSLSWSGLGASPLLSGALVLTTPTGSFTFDMTEATSFTLWEDSRMVQIAITAPNWSWNVPVLGNLTPGAFDLTQPYNHACYCDTIGGFTGAGFNGTSFEMLGETLTPVVPRGALLSVTAVPEPATWAMLILGFFGLGAALRANRRAAQAPV